MSDVPNPLAPPIPDWTPPSADMSFSQDAREHALRPAVGEGGVSRQPTNQEINDRLIEARSILGEDRFWQKSAPEPSAAERQAIETREALGVRPNAQPTDFTIALPGGVDPSANELIRSSLAALELSPVLGNYIGTKIGEVGRRLHQMTVDADRFDYANREQRKIAEWAESHGWPDVQAKRTEVQKLLSDRKVDPLIADIALHDSELFIRLAMHVEHLRSVKR